MLALITGATSGLGKELGILLNQKGYDLILVGRNKQQLNENFQDLNNVTLLVGDLCSDEFLDKLCHYIQSHQIDLLINNAGIGQYGFYGQYSIEKEKTLLKTNIVALDLLMKTYIMSQNHGRVVNISSIASKQVDPLMASYGASKSFVTMLSLSVAYELKKQHSSILVQVCLPGSFSSNFDKNANVKNSLKQKSASQIAQLILKDVFKNKTIIIPGFSNKLAYYVSHFIPIKLMNIIEYKIQMKKS